MDREIEVRSWPGDPYKGLAYYEYDDRELFAGRADDIFMCAHLLSDAQTRLLILHGQTGCGKSSFLRAGLIPALEADGPGYYFLRRSMARDGKPPKPWFIRCGDDPLSRIAEEVYVFAGEPIWVPTATGPERKILSAARLGFTDHAEFVRACGDPHTLCKALTALSLALPHTLVLVLDQAEEIITLSSSDPAHQSRFWRFIKEFVASDIDLRLVVAIRKDHSGQFIGSIQIDNELSLAFRTYFLNDLSPNGIREAILRPTLIASSDDATRPGPGAYYQFRFEPAVVDAILGDLKKSVRAGATLPVMQIVCRDLYEQVRHLPAPRVIGLSLYQQGGIEGRVKRHLEKSLAEVLSEQGGVGKHSARMTLRWLRVLHRLVKQEGDGRVHTDLVQQEMLEGWARAENIGADVGKVIERLRDPKLLILRKVAVIEAGVSPGKEMWCLGHDVIGIALGQALSEAEASYSVSTGRRRAGIVAALAFGLIVTAFYAYQAVNQANQSRHQTIESLLAGAATSRANDVVSSMMLASQAKERARPGWKGDNRADHALAALVSGLPSFVVAGKTAPLLKDSDFYPTHALPERGGFAVLRTGGALEVHLIDNNVVRPYTVATPGHLSTKAAPFERRSVSFSEASGELLLAMYSSSSGIGYGGVLALDKTRKSRFFSYAEMLDALGVRDPWNPATDLFSLSGNAIVFTRRGADGLSIHLKSLQVSESMELSTGADRRIPVPASWQVRGRHLVSSFYDEQAPAHPAPAAIGIEAGYPASASTDAGPAAVFTKLESFDVAAGGAPHTWEARNFASVQRCRGRAGGQPCELTVLPQLQQSGLVVLGLWEFNKGRFGPRAFLVSDLVIVDIEKRKTTEVDLRAAAEARHKCALPGARIAPPAAGGVKPALHDEDVPSFLFNGRAGLIMGYANRTSVQLVSVTSAGMSCGEIYFPAFQIDGWAVRDDGRTLLAVARDGGLMWNLEAGKPLADTTAKHWQQLCTERVSKFPVGASQPTAPAGQGKALAARICS